MHTLASPTSLLLLVAVSTLWMLGLLLNLSAPITASKVVTALLFVLMLVWFVVHVVGLVR
jgi:hypothetical protein